MTTDSAAVELIFKIITEGDTRVIQALGRVVKSYNDLGRAQAAQAIEQAKRDAAMARSAQRSAQQTVGALSQATAEIKKSGQAMQQAGYQINDIVTMIAAGASPVRALGVQLPQLLQGFGGIGIAASVAVGLVAALWTSFGEGEEATRGLGDATKDLASALDEYRRVQKEVNDTAFPSNALMADAALAVRALEKEIGALNDKMQEVVDKGPKFLDILLAASAQASGERSFNVNAPTAEELREEDVNKLFGDKIYADMARRATEAAKQGLLSEARAIALEMRRAIFILGTDATDTFVEQYEALQKQIDVMLQKRGLRGEKDAQEYFDSQSRSSFDDAVAKEAKHWEMVSREQQKASQSMERLLEQQKRAAQAIRERLDVEVKIARQIEEVNALVRAGVLDAATGEREVARIREEAMSRALEQQERLARKTLERLNKEIDAQRKINEEMLRRAELSEFGTPIDANKAAQEALRTAAIAGDISVEDAIQGIKRLKDELAGLTFEMKTNEAFTEVLENGFNRMFDEIARGAQDMNEVFKNVAKSIIAELLRILVVKSLVSLAGGPESKWGQIFAKAGGFAHGGVFDGNVVPFARGGVVAMPTTFQFARGGVPQLGLMGEAGPEAIMPLRRNRNGDLGVMAAAPSLNVVVNNNASGVDVQTSVSSDGTLTLDVVRASITRDILRGGNQLSRAMEQTYAVARGRR